MFQHALAIFQNLLATCSIEIRIRLVNRTKLVNQPELADELHGFTGVTGAGKTVMIHALFFLLHLIHLSIMYCKKPSDMVKLV